MAAEIRAAAGPVPGRSLRVFCPIWRKPWMSFNHDTFAHDLLRSAGGANLCADRPDRYPVVELQDIAQGDPEAILLPDEPYPFAERHRPALKALSLAPQPGVAAASTSSMAKHCPGTGPERPRPWATCQASLLARPDA